MPFSAQPNLTSPGFKADPFEFYRQLRDQTPIYRATLPGGKPAWLVTRYDDALELLRDPRLSKDKVRAGVESDLSRIWWLPRVVRALSRNMLDVDEPDHRRLRSLVQKAFTARVVDAQRGIIETLANGLLDRLNTGEPIDLISRYALPIPVSVIASLLGVEDADRGRFARWSNHIVIADTSPLHMARAVPNIVAFVRFIRRLVAARRRQPRPDLVSALIAAEDGGQTLSDHELVAMVFLLLTAGHETTVNLIGNAVLALAAHPDQLQQLREQPQLITSAVEELLRYCGPLQMATERYAIEDTPFGEVTFRRGDLIYAVLASANRDERQFSEPDTLQLDRTPNRHLAFGFGIHHCLGAPLARLEAQIALSLLVQRYAGLRIDRATASLPWRRGLILRGVRTLPVRLTRGAQA